MFESSTTLCGLDLSRVGRLPSPTQDRDSYLVPDHPDCDTLGLGTRPSSFLFFNFFFLSGGWRGRGSFSGTSSAPFSRCHKLPYLHCRQTLPENF